MSRRRSNRYSKNELDYLLEMNLFEEDEVEEDEDEESEEEMDDMPADTDEEMDLESSSDLDVAALEDALDDMESALGSARSALGSDSDDMDMEEPEGDDDDMDMEEPEGDDEELQLDGLFEVDEYMSEEDEVSDGLEAGIHESRRRNRVLEIDENMLRREIGRMKSLREGEAKDMASHFGGGSLEGEVFVDGVELNKLHEMKIKAAKVLRKNRMLESKLSQYKKALRGMKGQLQEMNLFNAKLLYANKLMQNRDLSIKQQRHIVESLDEAKTLGEAKILFESLSKSLVSSRPATRGGNLSEGVVRRRSGSSSAPVRSAQPMNESVALDRWATLAGIKK
jgi:hypothetical protein